jgi:hypothetical protein
MARIFIFVEEEHGSYTLPNTTGEEIDGPVLSDLWSTHELANPPTLLMQADENGERRFRRLAARLAASQSSSLSCEITKHIGEIKLCEGDHVLVLHMDERGRITGRRLKPAVPNSNIAA